MEKILKGVKPWSDGSELVPRDFSDEAREWKIISISDVNAKEHATAKIQAKIGAKTVLYLVDACIIPHKEKNGSRTWNIDTVELKFDNGRVTVL